MQIPQNDREVLKRLAERYAEIAALPVHKQTAVMWTELNDLKRVKPMVWINEIPWHEMDVDGELQLKTEHPLAQSVETELRRTIYLWEHMPVDMVVEEKMVSPLVIHDTGFGITEDVRITRTDERNSVVSREFRPQIKNEQDLEKIQLPQVTYDVEASERNYEEFVEIFGDILPVEKRGIPGSWFAPWDELVRWWGVQEALVDLVARPELVHQAMDRLVGAYLYRLDQWERLNLLAMNNTNVRVGSGGYGYTEDLPLPDCTPGLVRAEDIWGCAAAQIFSAVSPEMHEQFALKYELRWLRRFGLTYYGCCEPLHLKVGILRKVSNLRKISMSPWVDWEKAAEEVGSDYVISAKPNPAVLAKDVWNPEQARQDLREILEKTEGCSVEIIMKDISTVRYQPQRLWEWAQIAAEETEQFA